MFFHKIKIACMVASLVLSGSCASLTTVLPELDSSRVQAVQQSQLNRAFELYHKHNDRLQPIAAQILKANASLCEKTRQDLGVQTIKLRDLPEALRDYAQAQYGHEKEPFIINIYDAAADFKIGDQVLVSGKAIPASHWDNEAEYLSIGRGQDVLDLDLGETQTICDYRVKLRYSSVINAYATGSEIIVTSGMMDFASDDELALIIGHELAHNNLSHIRKIVQNRILLLGLATYSRKFESEADYAGLYYMARAGFDIDGAADFWRRYAELSVSSLVKPKSHPITPARFTLIEAAIGEIKDKQASRQPLEPNQK